MTDFRQTSSTQCPESGCRDGPIDTPASRRVDLCGLVLVSLLVAAVAGCSWGDEETEPPDTVAKLTLVAVDDLNPNVAGDPSPIVVVLYELAEPQAFDGAQFSQLFYDDGTKLAGEGRARLEFRIEPGQILETTRVLGPGTRHLGFVAGYREIERAKWRIRTEIEPSSTREHVLVIGARSLSLPGSTSTRVDESSSGESSSSLLGGLNDVAKGLARTVLPHSD